MKEILKKRGITNPFGSRVDKNTPSEEETLRVLENSEKDPEAGKPRKRPGFNGRDK